MVYIGARDEDIRRSQQLRDIAPVVAELKGTAHPSVVVQQIAEKTGVSVDIAAQAYDISIRDKEHISPTIGQYETRQYADVSGVMHEYNALSPGWKSTGEKRAEEQKAMINKVYARQALGGMTASNLEKSGFDIKGFDASGRSVEVTREGQRTFIEPVNRNVVGQFESQTAVFQSNFIQQPINRQLKNFAGPDYARVNSSTVGFSDIDMAKRYYSTGNLSLYGGAVNIQELGYSFAGQRGPPNKAMQLLGLAMHKISEKQQQAITLYQTSRYAEPIGQSIIGIGYLAGKKGYAKLEFLTSNYITKQLLGKPVYNPKQATFYDVIFLGAEKLNRFSKNYFKNGNHTFLDVLSNKQYQTQFREFTESAGYSMKEEIRERPISTALPYAGGYVLGASSPIIQRVLTKPGMLLASAILTTSYGAGKGLELYFAQGPKAKGAVFGKTVLELGLFMYGSKQGRLMAPKVERALTSVKVIEPTKLRGQLREEYIRPTSKPKSDISKLYIQPNIEYEIMGQKVNVKPVDYAKILSSRGDLRFEQILEFRTGQSGKYFYKNDLQAIVLARIALNKQGGFYRLRDIDVQKAAAHELIHYYTPRIVNKVSYFQKKIISPISEGLTKITGSESYNYYLKYRLAPDEILSWNLEDALSHRGFYISKEELAFYLTKNKEVFGTIRSKESIDTETFTKQWTRDFQKTTTIRRPGKPIGIKEITIQKKFMGFPEEQMSMSVVQVDKAFYGRMLNQDTLTLFSKSAKGNVVNVKVLRSSSFKVLKQFSIPYEPPTNLKVKLLARYLEPKVGQYDVGMKIPGESEPAYFYRSIEKQSLMSAIGKSNYWKSFSKIQENFYGKASAATTQTDKGYLGMELIKLGGSSDIKIVGGQRLLQKVGGDKIRKYYVPDLEYIFYRPSYPPNIKTYSTQGFDTRFSMVETFTEQPKLDTWRVTSFGSESYYTYSRTRVEPLGKFFDEIDSLFPIDKMYSTDLLSSSGIALKDIVGRIKVNIQAPGYPQPKVMNAPIISGQTVEGIVFNSNIYTSSVGIFPSINKLYDYGPSSSTKIFNRIYQSPSIKSLPNTKQDIFTNTKIYPIIKPEVITPSKIKNNINIRLDTRGETKINTNLKNLLEPKINTESKIKTDIMLRQITSIKIPLRIRTPVPKIPPRIQPPPDVPPTEILGGFSLKGQGKPQRISKRASKPLIYLPSFVGVIEKWKFKRPAFLTGVEVRPLL